MTSSHQWNVGRSNVCDVFGIKKRYAFSTVFSLPFWLDTEVKADLERSVLKVAVMNDFVEWTITLTSQHGYVSAGQVVSFVSDFVWPCGLSPPGSSVHGDSPDKDPGVGCHALHQGIFLTQGSNLCLLAFPALAGGFFTTSTAWEALITLHPQPTNDWEHKRGTSL